MVKQEEILKLLGLNYMIQYKQGSSNKVAYAFSRKYSHEFEAEVLYTLLIGCKNNILVTYVCVSKMNYLLHDQVILSILM